MNGTPMPIFHVSDLADAMREAGCRMRTCAAVRAAIADGRLRPNLKSPRGVQAWTAERAREDVEAQWRRDRAIAQCGRRAFQEPVQQVLQLGR
jgi:hypothetical protein